MAKSATQTRPSFGSVLDMPVADVKRPPLVPQGYYVCVVNGPPRIDKSSQKQTEFVEYALKIQEVWEKDGIPQVDEEALEEFGDVAGSIITVRYWTTEKAGYRLKEFLENCGVDTSGNEKLGQLIQEAAGCQVIAHIRHTPLQSGEGVRAEVRGTAAVGE